MSPTASARSGSACPPARTACSPRTSRQAGRPRARRATLQAGVDCRALPHADASLDAVVLDPPYMEGMYRREVGHLAGSGTHAAFRRAYSQAAATDGRPQVARRRRRPVRPRRPRGQPRAAPGRRADRQVSGRGQRQHAAPHPRRDRHRLRVARPVLQGPVRARAANSPGISRLKTQVHARKNHSYFLVFAKRGPATPASAASPEPDYRNVAVTTNELPSGRVTFPSCVVTPVGSSRVTSTRMSVCSY
jgi:hypothetical protein